MTNTGKLAFASDYMKGAHPAILRRLSETNDMQTAGYGADPITAAAKDRIRKACACPQAEVEFLVGGTQTNATVIDAFLRSWQGVVAAETGHISLHEGGAIEAAGHKVLTLPQSSGKISAEILEQYLSDYWQDPNHPHMVMPGMVYISHPTEYGTLYSKSELKAIREICDARQIPLYLDGARLAYALACPENDITLADLAELCDAFYIGGTKCGALLGEAVVLPNPDRLQHFFTIMKQHGAVLAKGRLLGIQFDELFRDDLYLKIGEPAIRAASRIREGLQRQGYHLCFGSPTNQVFCVMENSRMEQLAAEVFFEFWEKYDETHSIIRFAADWGTTPQEVEALLRLTGA